MFNQSLKESVPSIVTNDNVMQDDVIRSDERDKSDIKPTNLELDEQLTYS